MVSPVGIMKDLGNLANAKETPGKRTADSHDTVSSLKKQKLNSGASSGQSSFSGIGFTSKENHSDDVKDFVVDDDSTNSTNSTTIAWPSRKGPRQKKEKQQEGDEDESYIDTDGDSDEEEFVVPANEKSDFTFDYSLEKAKRWSAVVKFPKDVWSDGERDLFIRLAMRGFEPLIPKHWHFDFPTLPDSLFSEDEKDEEPIIHAVKSEFRCKLVH